jgi:hypothetical protein
MLRTVIIALVTGTAVGLDNLLARLAGWWHQTVPDDKFRAACERDQKYLPAGPDVCALSARFDKYGDCAAVSPGAA